MTETRSSQMQLTVDLAKKMLEDEPDHEKAMWQATFLAAEHTYRCMCASCILFFMSLNENDWVDDEWGPFGESEYRKFHEELGFGIVPSRAEIEKMVASQQNEIEEE